VSYSNVYAAARFSAPATTSHHSAANRGMMTPGRSNDLRQPFVSLESPECAWP
jgi:hypothetical protein